MVILSIATNSFSRFNSKSIVEPTLSGRAVWLSGASEDEDEELSLSHETRAKDDKQRAKVSLRVCSIGVFFIGVVVVNCLACSIPILGAGLK